MPQPHKADTDKTGLLARMAADGTATIELLGSIGEWGYTLKDWTTALDSVKSATAITLRINSPGGDIVEALAIRDLLRASGKTYRCEVYGLCASAATLIALACDTVAMAPGARWMVHEPQFGLSGNLRDFATMVETFTKLRADIYNIYATATGKTVEELQELMTTDVWYTAAEAKAFGWCHEIIGTAATDEEPEAPETPEDSEDAEEPEDTDPDALEPEKPRATAAAKLRSMLGLAGKEQKMQEAVAYWRTRTAKAEAIARGLRADAAAARIEAAAARVEAAAANQNVQERINAAVAAQLKAMAADGDTLPAPVASLPARVTLNVAEISRTRGADAAIEAYASYLRN